MNRDSEGRPIRLGDLVLGEYGIIVALGPAITPFGLRLESFYAPYFRTTPIRQMSPDVLPNVFGKRVIAR